MQNRFDKMKMLFTNFFYDSDEENRDEEQYDNISDFANVPSDIICYILQYLSYKDIAKLAQTNKTMHKIVEKFPTRNCTYGEVRERLNELHQEVQQKKSKIREINKELDDMSGWAVIPRDQNIVCGIGCGLPVATISTSLFCCTAYPILGIIASIGGCVAGAGFALSYESCAEDRTSARRETLFAERRQLDKELEKPDRTLRKFL